MPPHKDVRTKYFTFIDSPLSLEAWIWHRIFEVAVPRKPYYNPVNLWKARGDVKKKEFIQAIGFARCHRIFAHQRSRAPRGNFLFRVARMRNSRPHHAATHAQPLPAVQRSGRASLEACHLSAPRARIESRCDRSRSKAPRRC